MNINEETNTDRDDSGAAGDRSPLWLAAALAALFCLPLLLGALWANVQLAGYASSRILTVQQFRQQPPIYRMGLMFGASVRGDGSLSGVMSERVSTVAALLQQTTVTQVVLSGDGGSTAYDEVSAALAALRDAGVDRKRLIADKKGVRTLASLRHFDQRFGKRPVVLVSHRYHLRRALYLADRLGLQAIGVAAGTDEGYSTLADRLREVAARFKAWTEGWFL